MCHLKRKFDKFDEVQHVCFFCCWYFLCYSLKVIASSKASLVAQTVKSPPAVVGLVQSRVRKVPLEKGMAAYSSILAMEDSMDRGRPEEPTVHGSQRVRYDFHVTFQPKVTGTFT